MMRLNFRNWFSRPFERLKEVGNTADNSAGQLTKDELEFLPAALEVVETPPSPLGRAIVWLLIVLFVVALLWACIGHVDEVAVAQGKIIPSGYTKTIQSFDTGVVKAIRVKNGSKVQSGDVLIELDTTFTEADLARQSKEAAYYQLEITRLLAEQQNMPFVPEPHSKASPQDVQYQLKLYQSRRFEYQAKLAAAEQAVKQAEAAVATIEATKEKLFQQLAIIAQQEKKWRNWQMPAQ